LNERENGGHLAAVFFLAALDLALSSTES